jgi:hypothetical protein
MKKHVLKDQLYGTILEMTKNSKLYYISSISPTTHEYSNWREEGRIELQEFIEDITRKMLVAEQQELDVRAKELVFKELKKQHE